MIAAQKLYGCTPGAVVLFREPGAIGPLWPSIYLTDDATPEAFLRTRPRGLYSIVLKLGRVLDTTHLRWAQTSQMELFDPCAADTETKRMTPRLQEAYDAALDAIDAQFDLSYWKAILVSSQTPELGASVPDYGDLENDPEMEQAIRMGIVDVGPPKNPIRKELPAPQGRFTSSSSSSSPARPRNFIPDLHKSELSLPLRQRPQPPPTLLTPAPSPPNDRNAFGFFSRPLKRSSPSGSSHSDDDLPSPTQRRKFDACPGTGRVHGYVTSSQSTEGTQYMPFGISDSEELDDDLPPPPPRRRSRVANVGRPSQHIPQSSARKLKGAATSQFTAREVFRRNGLNAPTPAAPDADVIEGDLDESNQFVQIFVGPEMDPTNDSDIDPLRRRYKFQLLKHNLWDKPYLRNTLSAKNYIEPIGDNTWELVHPRLVDIAPEDFRWAAEYLSDGDFGHREPETEEEVADSFAQCMSAWRTAELLDMDDMLDHIVDKIRASQPWWDLWNVMAFTVSIYQSEVALQAHDELKALFSEYIAELFYIYLEDDHLSSTFTARLKQLPELERDVLKKRSAQLKRRAQPGEGEDVMVEEEQEDNMDLYS
ncbi:hypothetical protein E8E11_003799 [Didymella keratinophila]|nr:hypothetical protein E8E11_003799 [Didymella keratinophila]